MSFKEALLRTNSKPLKIETKKLIPTSMYYGTEDYYREKLGDRLPDEQYQIMELQTHLCKHNQELNENHINFLNSIREEAMNEYNRIMEEFKEREEEGKNDNAKGVIKSYGLDIPIENLNINPENYFICK